MQQERGGQEPVPPPHQQGLRAQRLSPTPAVLTSIRGRNSADGGSSVDKERQSAQECDGLSHFGRVKARNGSFRDALGYTGPGVK